MIRQSEQARKLLHIRFEGRSGDVPLFDLDIGIESTDQHVKSRLAAYLGIDTQRLRDYRVDRHATGNITVRPEAVFG